MRCVVLAVFCISASVMAQPLEGPWEVVNSSGTQELSNPHLLAWNDSTANLFYQIVDTVYHAAVDLREGNLRFGPTVFPAVPDGQRRQLHGVTANADVWSAITYDVNTQWNTTRAVFGRDVPQSALTLHSRPNCLGMESTGSSNDGFSITSGDSGRFLAAWQNAWCWWGGSFGCAGCGPMLAVFDEFGEAEISPDEPFGFCAYTDPTTTIGYLNHDSTRLISTGYGAVEVVAVTRDEFRRFEFSTVSAFSCAQDLLHVFVTRGRNGFALAGGVSPRLLTMPNLSSCASILNLNSLPIAFASNPDYGIAWLSRLGHGLMLYRVDTTGTPVHPAGVLHWPEAGFQIAEAALTLTDDGRVVAVWSERESENEFASILRLASVGWNTYLDADERPANSVPSSLSLAAYPNPFNTVLRVSYAVPRAQQMELAVFNVLGQKVETLFAGTQTAGAHEAAWSPRGAGGIYFLSLTAGTQSRTSKVLYLK